MEYPRAEDAIDQGAVYHSIGERYSRQCAISARVLKATNPQLKTALFTDDVDFAKEAYSDAFDVILSISDGADADELIENLKITKRLASLKVAIAHRSPFKKTLLIDGDTLAIGCLREAFDMLNDYDLLLCQEIDHYINESDGWKASGLKNDRRATYFNAGVIFFNADCISMRRFVENWKDTLLNSKDDYARKNDQDALNYMISRPLEFLTEIRFSGSILETSRYNAFCRYWKEIWERGQWFGVKIVHTYMTINLGSRFLQDSLNWEQVLNDTSTEDGFYINSFKSDWSTQEKLEYAYFSSNRSISMMQYLKYKRFSRGISMAEDLALLYSMSECDTKTRILHLLHIIESAVAISPISKITQIGLYSQYSDLSLFNSNPSYSIGGDLSYLRHLFKAEIRGISRAKFLSFSGEGIKTSFVEYAIEGNIENTLEENQDLIIDFDCAVPAEIRVANAIACRRFLSKGGIYIIANIKGAEINTISHALRDFYKVEIAGEALRLNSLSGIDAPNVIIDYTPLSCARIALVGNCQSSAVASILRRVKDIRVEIVVDINLMGSEAYQHAHWAVAHTDRVDFCFSQQMSDSFGEISSDKLKRKYGGRFKSFTNLYFTGFHPDIIYLGARGVRIQSAMGDYNSRVALLGYVHEMDVGETVSLFNSEVYNKLGFYDQFRESRKELLTRDALNDVRFAEEFFCISENSLPLYSVNHPTVHVLAPLAERIVAETGANRPKLEPDFVINPLIEGSIWPIYPEISSHLALKYKGGMSFIPGMSEQRSPMDLRDFVAETFYRYDSGGKKLITDLPASQDLKTISL